MGLVLQSILNIKKEHKKLFINGFFILFSTLFSMILDVNLKNP
jgi:hypothetical protein